MKKYLIWALNGAFYAVGLMTMYEILFLHKLTFDNGVILGIFVFGVLSDAIQLIGKDNGDK